WGGDAHRRLARPPTGSPVGARVRAPGECGRSHPRGAEPREDAAVTDPTARDARVDNAGGEERGDEARHPEVTVKRVGLGILRAGAVGAILVVSIGRLAGFANLTETLERGDPAWLTVCAVGQIIVFSGYAGALRRAVAFEGGPQISTGLSLRVVLASFSL